MLWKKNKICILFYFVCLATYLLEFYLHTTLSYYGNYVIENILQMHGYVKLVVNTLHEQSLFTLITLDYWMLTLKEDRSAKNIANVLKIDFWLCFHGNSLGLWSLT